MTQLADKEPAHWHTTDAGGKVRHNMNDPRTFDMPRAHWSADERDYVEHLVAHETQRASVEPLPGDHELVRSTLQVLTNQEKTIALMRELVLTLREELAGGTPVEESKAAAALRDLWPQFSGPDPASPEPSTT